VQQWVSALSRFGLHEKYSDDKSEILHQRESFGTHEKKTERIVTEEKFLEDLGTFGQFWAEKICGGDCGFIRGESGEITG